MSDAACLSIFFESFVGLRDQSPQRINTEQQPVIGFVEVSGDAAFADARVSFEHSNSVVFEFEGFVIKKFFQILVFFQMKLLLRFRYQQRLITEFFKCIAYWTRFFFCTRCKIR